MKAGACVFVAWSSDLAVEKTVKKRDDVRVRPKVELKR